MTRLQKTYHDAGFVVAWFGLPQTVLLMLGVPFVVAAVTSFVLLAVSWKLHGNRLLPNENRP